MQKSLCLISSLASIGVVLDFGSKFIVIDHISNPKQRYEALKDTRMLNQVVREEQMSPWPELEPISTREANKQAVTILDEKYKKADLPAIVSDNFNHLDSLQQAKLLASLEKNDELFDDTLGDFQTDPVRFDLQLGTKPYNGRPFPVPRSRMDIFKKEVERRLDTGVLKRQPLSEWGSPAFIIPKSNQTVRILPILGRWTSN